MSAQEKPVYRFGDCELDPGERRLLVAGVAMTLTPKVFDTLVLLVERAGHVVSKDELLRTLWPRGFVDESNLTKHIWMIRKALGERDGEWIETVPKTGYRFAVPVERVGDAQSVEASSASTAPPLDHMPMTKRSASSRPLLAGLAVGVLVVIATVTLWHRGRVDDGATGAANPGRSIAIAGFNNLSQNPKDAWLDPALGEMLASEIATGGRVHALPDERVRSARTGLPTPLAGGYASGSLATLRKRLGADYVLSGSYLISGSDESSQLRLDLTVQDARSGALLATSVHSGTVGDLNALVTTAGGDLRERLGIEPMSAEVRQQIARLQPPTDEVARRIGFALDALHRSDPARARDELLGAIAQAPGYAPAYSYLSQAWAALGYAQKAIAASKQATAHAQGLPDEQALQIATQAHRDQHDWPAAIDAARKLVQLRADDPEYRFQLVDTLIAAGKATDAQAEYDALFGLRATIANDARLELLAAHLPRTDHESEQRAQHAARALQLAREHDDVGCAAEAGALLGIARWHLGDLDGAKSALRQARADYARIGNPHGEAWVDQNIGNAYSDADAQLARESYQRALITYRDIGDRDGEAAIYSNLSRLLWSAGDRDGTQAAVRSALALRRETADLAGEAWNLSALAIIQLDDAATDEVEAEFKQALALDEQAGETSHHAFMLMQYADLQRLRGQLEPAAKTCADALAAYRALADDGGIASTTYECASITLDRGDVTAAQAGFEDAAKQSLVVSDSVVALNAALGLAQIEMARGDWIGASARLRAAAEQAARSELVTGEATAQALLALCEMHLGDAAGSARAAARARELRSRTTERLEVLAVDIALPQLSKTADERDAAIRTLRALADDADKRGWIAWSLEARLALLQVLESAHDREAAEVRDRLAGDAGRYGFAWVRRKVG